MSGEPDDERDPNECVGCGQTLHLDFGREWPDDGAICWECLLVQRDALLAFAECHAAFDSCDWTDAGTLALHAVLKPYGYQSGMCVDFVRSLRDSALAKVRG